MFSISTHPLPFHTDDTRHVNINLSAEGSSLFSPESHDLWFSTVSHLSFKEGRW